VTYYYKLAPLFADGCYFRTPTLAGELQVFAAIVPLIHVTSFSAYESLPDSGSGAGPQRSVEGWVVFVTGIYEETQVLIEVAPSTESDACD
jgi:hypothetical protein